MDRKMTVKIEKTLKITTSEQEIWAMVQEPRVMEPDQEPRVPLSIPSYQTTMKSV
jgi:hypothetical protein